MKKKICKIENVNNFSLRLKIEMIIFIISHQMYYTDFYYISSNVVYYYTKSIKITNNNFLA